MKSPFNIRFEIEGIKHSMVTALSKHQDQIAEQSKRAVERYLANVDWDLYLETILNEQLKRALSEAVYAALSDTLMMDETVKEILRAGIREGLVESLAKSMERSMGGR